jgi:4-hydroxybenzoate polyprenyltransferase
MRYAYGMLQQLLRLARPGQWTKNGLLFGAIVFAGEVRELAKLETVIAAAAIFCLLSSAVYTINDMIDREKDRSHPVKKHRPLASGAIAPGVAGVFAGLLIACGLTGAWLVNSNFLYISVGFLVLNLAYSLFLKQIIIVDVLTIAISFVVRAFAGALAIDVPASGWMLMNTLLLALFLSFGKRRHEMVLLEAEAGNHRAPLSGYTPYLLDQMIGVTTASVLVVYMLYTFSGEVSEKLGTEYLYITIPFVVYGIFRYLYLIHRKDEGGSPTQVLISDRPILITVILWLITALLLIYPV